MNSLQKTTCITCIHIGDAEDENTICPYYNIIEDRFNLKKCPKYEHFALEEYYELLTETVQLNNTSGGRKNVS